MDVLPEADVAYAELQCVSNFSFLRGASQPVELVERASTLGYRALALTDECSVAGVVRAHMRAKELSLPLIIGSQFTFTCGLKLIILAATRKGYGQLCQLITRGRRTAPKGSYRLSRADLVDCIAAQGDCLLIWPPDWPRSVDNEPGHWLVMHYPGVTWLGVSVLREGEDAHKLRESMALAVQVGMGCVACGDIHMHAADRRPLQDALTAIRHGMPLRRAGQRLFANGQRHLRERTELARLYPPALLQETVALSSRCHFSLDQLRYEYPHEIVPAGETPASYLRRLTEEGAAERWPGGVPGSVRTQLERELALIAELGYEPFFLTVYDIAAFARSAGILHQGRGSAANSIVCYCLKVTAVGPDQLSMLFERFVSREREEPPDIDIDFEHERREEVIQYIYGKYGRERAALAATVITYQVRSAVRDLALALDVDEVTQRRLVMALRGWHGRLAETEKLRAAGIDPEAEPVATLLRLAATLVGFPRHLSQHVGGFVISEGPLAELVPVENATMPERTVIQWDKDDLEDLRLLKVDVLGLGMLTAIRRCFDLVARSGGPRLRLDAIAMNDAAVYDMICRADTIGVFQIESRAQMSMLPRLLPRTYYDLVIEVAIVHRTIQGNMVHPYLRRRSGAEPVVFPSEAVRSVLARTCGVPIFQEQVMQLAVVAADFTPGEADQLRRSMAAWKRRGGVGHFEEKLITGMRRNGYAEQFARQIVNQIRGFSEYGFPEAMRPVLQCWHTSLPGSSATIRQLSPQRCSTASRWGSTRRRSCCAMRGPMAWRCVAWMSVPAMWNPHWKGVRMRKVSAEGRRCDWALPAHGRFRRQQRNASWPPAMAPRSVRFRTWATGPGCHDTTWKCWQPPARWPVSRDTGTWRTGAWPAICRHCPQRRMRSPKVRDRCCVRPPRPKTSSRITGRWGSRWAGIRWRCCASGWRKPGS